MTKLAEWVEEFDTGFRNEVLCKNERCDLWRDEPCEMRARLNVIAAQLLYALEAYISPDEWDDELANEIHDVVGAQILQVADILLRRYCLDYVPSEVE